MVKLNKKSVSLSALWVSTNDRVSDFYTSSWQRGESPVPMLVVRLALALVGVAIFTWSLVDATQGGLHYWLIYLTNWGILLVVATMLSGLIVSILAVCKRMNETAELPWYVSLYWLLFNTGVTLAIIITALYWTLLYKPELKEEAGLRAFWRDIATHGFTSCIMVTEMLVSRTPVRLAHIYQPLGIALWYAAFSAIYYGAGGTDSIGNTYIYELLDWENSRRAIIVVMSSTGALIILYLVLWGIAFCRDKISIALVRTRSHDLPMIPHNPLDSRIV